MSAECCRRCRCSAAAAAKPGHTHPNHSPPPVANTDTRTPNTLADAPAITNPDTAAERFAYKLRFYHALELRVRDLRRRGRAVVVVGDWNISPSPVGGVGQDEGWCGRCGCGYESGCGVGLV